MTKLFLLLSLFAVEFNQVSLVKNIDDYRTSLTGSGTKSWYLYARTPDEASATCKATHAVSLDNTYTFSSNGTFEFDHGSIIKDDTCEHDCCSDLVNLVGKWKFTNSKQGIKITGEYEKGVPSNAQTIILYDATIDQLDDNVLRISQNNPETNVLCSFEFRKK